MNFDRDMIVGKHTARRNKGLQESPIPGVYAKGVDLLVSDEDCRNVARSKFTAVAEQTPK